MASLFRLIKFNVLDPANGILRTSSPLTQTIEHFTKVTAIRRKLGLPEPPKKPMNAFMKFVHATKLSIEKPISSRELIKQSAEKWRNLTEEQKQQYYHGYKEAVASYKRDLEAYNERLGVEKLQAIREKINESVKERIENIEKRNEINLLHELGKPKKPLSAFIIFRMDKQNAGTTMQAAGAKWSTLSESEKKIFEEKSKKLRKIYNKELIKWESQMVSQGRGHLVRQRVLRTKTK